MNMHNDHDTPAPEQSWLFSRTGIATILVVSVLGFLVYEGHGAHLLGYAPFLLILACPLMHIFMHGGHGGHGGHGDHQEEDAPLQRADNQNQSAQTSNTPPQAAKHDHSKGGCH